MGKLQRMHGRTKEEEARWAIERACERVEVGDLEGALCLLDRAEHLHPAARGLPEIQAIAHVCHAVTRSPCACSGSSQQQQASPQWYHILKVSEEADRCAIKKRYHQLALLLHPDKNKHPRAEEAFKLVSEAFAQLYDTNKRAQFDIDLRQRRCKKCCFDSSWNPATNWSSMRRYPESLKGKNQSSYAPKSFFPSDFHTAEWRMEHEKLRIFRERAQAKVDSLAQILKESRSRWNEEMGTTKASCKKGSAYISSKKAYQSRLFDQPMEKGAFPEIDRHWHARDGAFVSSAPRSDHVQLSQILDNKGGLSTFGRKLFGELKSKRARERQIPQLLQNLDGLLGIVKEEISVTNAGIKVKEKMKKLDQHTAHFASLRGRHQQYGDKLEEELIVIDNFLAGLSEGLSPNGTKETCPLVYKTPHEYMDRRPDLKSFKNGGCMQKKTANGLHEGLVSESPRQTNGFAEKTGSLVPPGKKSNVLPPKTKSRMADNFAQNSYQEQTLFYSNDLKFNTNMANHTTSRQMNTENRESLVTNQKNASSNVGLKSEELLRMLERLREETRSVAATLESMKKREMPPILPASMVAT